MQAGAYLFLAIRHREADGGGVRTDVPNMINQVFR